MVPIIKVDHLSKKYMLGVLGEAEDSLRESLIRGFRKPWDLLRGKSQNGSRASSPSSMWALRDINFEIYPGDTVGIIGSNGAGKSTLLKILARITDPTEGTARLRGRTGCLLEVGTGFHPELTGRENIFLNGAILGMTRAEICSKFDEIVAFAEIDKFLDTPVKHFSSGMYLRLAFAVAAHLEPEILIVDEALAVGDMAFQKKCLAKMREFSQSGHTVLFVSHSLAALENLCRKGIVLRHGELVFSGSASEAIKHYLGDPCGQQPASASAGNDLSRAPGRASRFRPLLKRMELLNRDSQPLHQGLPLGEALKAQVLFELKEPTSLFGVTLAFDNLFAQRVLVASSNYQPDLLDEEHCGERLYVCEIPNFTLTPGEYRIQVTLSVGGAIVDRVEDAARLIVVGSDFYGTGRMPTEGTCVLEQSWRLQQPTQSPSDRLSNSRQPSIPSLGGLGK
jgi:lipopolysaccharide transport system ATP-binding protein